MAKKTAPDSTSQLIAESEDWILTHCRDPTGRGKGAWILKKKWDDNRVNVSGRIHSFTDEDTAFAACRERGLQVEVRSKS